jgi:hypothetical protein
VSRALMRMVQSGGKRFHMGHGGPLEAPAVLQHALLLAKIGSGQCADGQCHHHAY